MKPRAKAKAAPPALLAAGPASEEGGEEGASVTASTFSRASAIRALESAIPNVESHVAMATAAMAPAAAHTPPPEWARGGADYLQPVQQPTQQTITINFTGDLAQLGRVLKPVIDIENRRIGPGV